MVIKLIKLLQLPTRGYSSIYSQVCVTWRNFCVIFKIFLLKWNMSWQEYVREEFLKCFFEFLFPFFYFSLYLSVEQFKHSFFALVLFWNNITIYIWENLFLTDFNKGGSSQVDPYFSPHKMVSEVRQKKFWWKNNISFEAYWNYNLVSSSFLMKTNEWLGT